MNKWCKGMGYWCPSCRGEGWTEITDIIEFENGERRGFTNVCKTCGGDGRIEATIDEVLNGTVPQYSAPKHYSVMRPVTIPIKRANQ